jgi:hypothetical protein
MALRLLSLALQSTTLRSVVAVRYKLLLASHEDSGTTHFPSAEPIRQGQ